MNQVNRSPIVENLEKVLSTTIKSLPTNDASQYKVYREVIDTINDFKLQLQDLLEFTSKMLSTIKKNIDDLRSFNSAKCQ